VDNLFFYSGGQSVSCKASLAADGYFLNFVLCYYRRINMMMMMMSFVGFSGSPPCVTFTYWKINVTD